MCKLNKKVKDLARLSVLTDKAKSKNITIVEDLKFTNPKTKDYVNFLSNLGFENEKTMLVLVEKDDMIYLFTDGYVDQFGGPSNKKFKYKPFKRLLLSISEMETDKQKNSLIEEFQRWKGDTEQVDIVQDPMRTYTIKVSCPGGIS